MSNELRLSVSKAKCFNQCKKQYKFSYILKLPKKERDYHVLGKFCHKVLEDFHLAFLNGSQDAYSVVMSKAFKDALTEYKLSMTPEMKKECWKIIDQYLKIMSTDKKNNLCANVIACEKKFELLVGDKIMLNGMIDRIQIDADNVIHVCDYKTSNSKSKEFLKKDFFQLLTYAYVIISEDPSIKKVRASYIMMKHNFEYITKEFTVAEIMAIEKDYIKYAEQILAEQEYPANPSNLCNFCDFLNDCPEGKARSFNQNIYGEVSY